MTFVNTYIKIKECATCKGCCVNIPESICGYNTLEEIKRNRISEEYIKKMVIYHIADSIIDVFAKKDNMYPIVNLMRYITIAKDNYYDFLTYPTVEEGCIMLSENGCLFPVAKPFECGLHPFYMYKLHFRTDYECRYTKKLEDEIQQREMVGKYIIDYLLYSEKNKTKYFDELCQLQMRYHLPIITINSL